MIVPPEPGEYRIICADDEAGNEMSVSLILWGNEDCEELKKMK